MTWNQTKNLVINYIDIWFTWYKKFEYTDFTDYLTNYLTQNKNNYQTLYNIEQTISELFIRISLDSVNLIFSLITILLVIIRILSDHNHENENNSIYFILWFSTLCLIVCFITNDLFWFYLGFKSITIPVYYLIHMYRSDIDKFKACDWYALFSFFSSAVLSFAVAMLANLYRTTNIQILIRSFESIELNCMTLSYMHYVYLSLILAFMIKSPVVPFHM